MSHHDLNAVFYSSTYHPIQAGSIDGTDTLPHDNAVYRAMLATSTGLYDPVGDPKASGNPHCVVFIGRLSKDTTESTLQEVMSKYGRIKNVRLVRHIVTGASQGYAFVEYETEKEMQYAYEDAHLIKIDGSQVLVDYNRQLLMPGWIPRRLGGGLGGNKESGQLRFGGRDRPFRKPLRPIPGEELEKLGIPLPGGYMHRYEVPPLPRRKSSQSGTKTKVDENACEVKTTDYKRRHDERHAETRRSYGEMDDDRQLDDRYERRKSSEDRMRSKQHHYEHHDRGDYEQDDSGRTRHHDRRNYERQPDSGKSTHHHDSRDYEVDDSGRTHHHDRQRKKDTHGREEGKHHRHHKREDDTHSSRQHKRSHHSRADRSPSVSYSSKTDDGGKTRKVPRHDADRYDTKESSVDDRWKP